jgi:hypothetical protein
MVFLWPFGTFFGHLVNFSPFWYVAPRKIWQPWREKKNCPVLLTEYLLRLFASRENTAATGGKQSNVDKVASILLISLHISFFSLKLPPYTLAGFELTTNKFPSGDETTMQTTRAL